MELHRGTVLFSDPDPNLVRDAAVALRGIGCKVQTARDPEALAQAMAGGPFDLIFYGFPEGAPDASLFSRVKEAQPKARLVLMAGARLEDYLPSITDAEHLTNFCARAPDSPDILDELLITARKLLSGDIFGVEKYLMPGVDRHQVLVTDSSRKEEHIREVGSFCEEIGCRNRVLRAVEGFMDEFLMNAIFDAPVDEQGRPLYAGRNRTERVTLTDEQAAVLSWACDGKRLGVAVEDPFGRLTPRKVMEYLRRCFAKGEDQIEGKPGGAGLGLFKVYMALDTFVVNLQPGRRTEVVGLLDLRRRGKEGSGAVKSFHFFVTGQEP